MTTPDSRPPADRFRIQFADGDLNFRSIQFADPVPTGRQFLLNAVGPTAESTYSLFMILPTGDFEDIRLDETVDLREHGEERFIGFETDRAFKLEVEDSDLQWGKPLISGRMIYKLAGVAEGDQDLYLRVRGAHNRLVRPNDVVDLAEPGIERFFFAARELPGFEIVVIYNGQPAPQRVLPDESLQTVHNRAMAAFGHPAGGPVLFNEAGAELTLTQTVTQAGLTNGARLILRPRVVQGG